MVNTKTGIKNTNLLPLSVTPDQGKVYPVSRLLLPARLLLVLGLILFVQTNLKGQCGVGYTSATVDGSGHVVTYQTGVPNPNLILGDADDSGAEIYDGSDVLDLDLGSTLAVGEQYTIYWNQKTGAGGISRLSFYESPDGTN